MGKNFRERGVLALWEWGKIGFVGKGWGAGELGSWEAGKFARGLAASSRPRREGGRRGGFFLNVFNSLNDFDLRRMRHARAWDLQQDWQLWRLFSSASSHDT